MSPQMSPAGAALSPLPQWTLAAWGGGTAATPQVAQGSKGALPPLRPRLRALSLSLWARARGGTAATLAPRGGTAAALAPGLWAHGPSGGTAATESVRLTELPIQPQGAGALALVCGGVVGGCGGPSGGGTSPPPLPCHCHRAGSSPVAEAWWPRRR